MQAVPRLYHLFQPKHYALTLDLRHADQRTFSGQLELTGLATSDGTVQLHAKDLEIDSVRLGDTQLASSLTGDTLSITSDIIKQNAEITVSIEFHGRITDSMHGVYPCYFEHDGQKKELFATQFESHHAREVFPCVDEPEAKATFDLTLVTPLDVNELSNMPSTSIVNSDDTTTHHFATTPLMSTYLLAFVTGELQKKSARTRDGV